MEALMAERTEVGMAEWSNGRLDEFATRIDERFDRAEEKTDERFDRIEEAADQGFTRVDEKFVEVDRRLGYLDREVGRVNNRLDDLIKVLIAGFIGFTGAVIAGFAAMVALFAAQL
jgi:hypothetical protein